MLKRVTKRMKGGLRNKKLAKRGVRIAAHVDCSNVTFGNYVNLAHHSQVSNSTIGDRTSIGRYSKVQFSDIGKFCSISWDVTIGALEHPIHAISTHAFSFRKQFGLCSSDTQIPHKRVVIGNDVWIGCGAILMPGITVGNGAVIGAGAVVTHDVQPYEVVAGCPARHIAMRFEKETIDRLQEIKWWDMSDAEIKKHMDAFRPDVDIFEHPEILDQFKK